MKPSGKGYYVYSIIAVTIGFALFGFWGYLLYDLIIKLATKEITNATLIQSLITLIATVFIGGYFSEAIKRTSNKRLELLKTQRDIAIKIVELMGVSILCEKDKRENALSLLVIEIHKAKLFFDDKIVVLLNSFFNKPDSRELYAEITDNLKKYFK